MLTEFLVSLLPIRGEMLNELGIASFKAGRPRIAAAFLSHAIKVAPEFGSAIYNLGLVLQHQNQFDRAIACFQRAIELGTLQAEAENNLGVIHLKLGQLDDAARRFNNALRRDPSHANARTNLAHVLDESGFHEEALKNYASVIRQHPGHVEAHFGLGLQHLKSGHWKPGWLEYEWRFQRSPRAQADLIPPVPEAQRWSGQSLVGKRILLRAEQGLGDSIQFCRFAATLHAMGARVCLSVQKPLVGLLSTVNGVESVCPLGKERSLGPVDFWSPLLSLPQWLNVSAENVANEIPYIHIEEETLHRWRKRMRSTDGRFRVGLAWAGNPTHENDRNRSMALEQLASLASANCTFYSLQCGLCGREARYRSNELRIVPIAEKFRDFTDTAAVIANLDLVITVDTVVAHLAGAMGCPVWTLLPFNSDWRWQLDRDDSPWYPTMRLYRQPNWNNWNQAIEMVANDLSQLAKDTKI